MVAYRLPVLLLIAAASAVSALAPVSGAKASTPTLIWTGIKRVNILCNVAGGPGIDHPAMTAQLCRDARRLAAKGAPVPVNIISLGDPAVLASDSVTLLVHGSVATHGRDRLLAFSVRPYRTSADQTSVLFGAAPRVAPISALDSALGAALTETLPWLARPAQSRPL